MSAKDKSEELFEKIVYQCRGMDEVLELIRDAYVVEDVFDASELHRWAESEGYIKPENT